LDKEVNCHFYFPIFPETSTVTDTDTTFLPVFRIFIMALQCRAKIFFADVINSVKKKFRNGEGRGGFPGFSQQQTKNASIKINLLFWQA
jgi:hypothetical protein